MRLCQSVRYTFSISAICFLLHGISIAEDIRQEHGSLTISKASIEPEGRALFNPRVDYNNQWLPVGHSDPLKNDPTFDYVPPTLGSVRYWSEESDSSQNTNKNNLTGKASGKDEILLLGAPVEHSANLQSNHLSQTETKAASANRRSSPYYPPEPSRQLTPPPLQSYTTFDKSGFPSDHNYYASPSNYWSNDLPVMHPNDAYSEESASYVTVIRPKVNPHPYATTIYNKNIRNSIYHLAANVNSLEPVDNKKPHWVHSLLQKEITYPMPSTTPQVILAYSPHVHESSQSTTKTTNSADHPRANDTMMEVTTTTIPTPTSTSPSTSDAIYSYHNQPALPIRRPMYLIIQGHSKVKTYGNNNSGNKSENHEPKMVPIVSEDPIVKHVVSLDSTVGEYQVKHLHKSQANEAKIKTTTASNKPTKKVTTPMVSLLSLLDSSLASFGLSEKESKSKLNDLKKSHDRIITSTARVSSFFGPTTIKPNE